VSALRLPSYFRYCQKTPALYSLVKLAHMSIATDAECGDCPPYHETLESPNANQSVGLLEHLAESQRFEESIQILAKCNAGEFRGKVAATSSK
jgi:hypothetical protein